MRVLFCLLLGVALTLRADESARVILERGAAHEKAGRLAEASRDYAAATRAAEASGNRDVLVDALSASGYLQYYLGEMNEALVNLQRAYELAVAEKDEKAQRTILETIAHIYADTKVAQYDRAIDYYRQLLRQFEAAGDEAGIADTLYNLASTYERKEDLPHALEWYRRALAAEEKLKRPGEAAFVKRSIGATLGKLGRYDEALPLLDEALRAFAARSETERAMIVRQSRGIVHRRAGNVNAAIADLEATRGWFAQQKNTRYLEKTEEELALVYAASGRWRDAYDARSRHATLQRELAEKLREEHTSRLRVQFDAERKERENRALLRENAAASRIRTLQTVILVLAAAIVAVLAYLMFRLARDKRRMREMAMTDELTRLPNRRHVLAAAEEQLAHARTSNGELSVIAFDLDHFKRINDTWGHAAGDLVLQRVAHTCRTALRPGDQIGRTGGEEFMVVLPSTNERDAVAVAERLRAAVEAIDFADIDPALRVTISLGVAARTVEDTLARLSAAADELLYRAKELGRNQVISRARSGDWGAGHRLESRAG
ncbi:MAG TPA: tetratricopeptide repeat-containing diguanylate cyclase [Thermoanaerobaculia bacterium]|nr:tetratricopeptide repeat-containing diguanylate cyclase [Thermoanaerobaculia bacterium]